MALLPATNKQVPEHSILDMFGKQSYLGNQFIVGTNSVSLSGTGEVALLYMACTTAATQAVGASQNAKGIFCNLRRLYCADSSALTGVVFRVYFGASTVSAGTALTPNNARPAYSTASVASVLLSPTVGTKGTFAYSYAVGFQSPAVSEELIILDAGTNMLITAQASAASTAIADLTWFEI